MNKTNSRSKLLVAVLAMFLVVVGAAVAVSDSVNADGVEPTEQSTNVAMIGKTPYTDIDTAIDAAQVATTDAGKVIDLTADVTISSTENLTGITINCGPHDLTFSGTTPTITGGTINGTGLGSDENSAGHYGDQIVKINGTSKVTFNGTIFNSVYTEITDGNTYQKGNYAYYIIYSSAPVDFIGCQFNSTQPENSDYSDWGAIFDNSSAMTLKDCTIQGQGKINYISNGTLTLDGTQAYLQLVGTNKTVDLKNFSLLNDGRFLGTFYGWGFNDSSYLPTGTANAAPAGQENVKVTFNDTRGESQQTPVDFGQFYKGNDTNSVANGTTSVETTPEVEYEPDVENITITQGGKPTISGTIATSNTNPYAASTIFKNVTVNPGVVLTIAGDVEVQGYFNLYGTIDSGATEAEVNVTSGAEFTAYAGAYLGNNVTILGDGDIDLSAALYTGEWNQDIVSDITLSQIQRVVINDTITVYSGRTFEILGELVINEGATIIIQPGAKLKIGDTATRITATGMTVNGTIEVEGNQTSYGTIKVEEAQEVTIGGSILSEGLIDISSKVTVENGGTIEVMEGDNSKLAVDEGLTVENGGVLTISSKFYTPGINNKGTVTLDHAILDFTDVTGTKQVNINLVGDGAVVQIDSVTAPTAGVLRIQDNGLAFETDRNGDPVAGEFIPDTAGDSNAVHIDFLSNGSGVRGLTVTESVTSVRENGDTLYSNSMYISGTVNVESDDENAKVNIDLRGAGRTAADAGGLYIDAESSVTLGKNVTMDLVNGIMYVNGTFTATSEGAGLTSLDTTDIYVDGMITVEGAGAEPGMNAFHYEGTGETADYDYYTTLPVALENSADIRFLGNVTVLEDATIPEGTRLTAASTTPTPVMNIGDEDNRDVIVTVANGGSIRNGNVKVYATLVFENNSRDNRVGNDGSGISSDVVINADPARTYTNIYTALADAQDETVTLSTKWDVKLNEDITVPETVTLVVPAGATLNIYDAVTLTVDGTLRNSGTIQNIDDPDDDDQTPAGFNPEVNGEPNTDAAAIVVNGAFMSLNEIPFDTVGATQGYYIPGAYYQIIDSNGAWYYVTPIEQAATVSGDVNNGQIDIKGEVETSDVAFTGDEDVPVTVSVIGDLTAGTVTLSYATLEVETTGSYTGSVANTAGSVDLTNVKNVTVQGTVDDDEAATVLLVINGTPVAADADADSAVSIATGTVNAGAQLTVNTNIGGTVTQIVDEFTVASGAQLTVDNANFTADEISVDGTLYAVNGGKVTVDTLTVRGTFTVAANDTANHITAGVADINTLYIGIAVDDEYNNHFVDASAATVNANNLGSRLSTVFVSAESTFDGKLTQTMDHTEFYVEDALWMTVYTNYSLEIHATSGSGDDAFDYYNFVPGDLQSSAFVSWMNADGKDVPIGTEVGKPGYEQVYANIDYNVYGVVITVDNSIGSVAIDGQLLTYDYTLGGYIIPGDNWKLTAGQHTVTYTLAAGYEGTPTLASNGTNVTVSGMNFTLSGDFLKSDGTPNINYLTLGGATYSGNTVVIDGGNGGSNDMGLTDYLLIVLVILIVIMAIIVALRLMRS